MVYAGLGFRASGVFFLLVRVQGFRVSGFACRV